MLFESKMAQREGFEPPCLGDSGFQVHRNTGLCDLCNKPWGAPPHHTVFGCQASKKSLIGFFSGAHCRSRQTECGHGHTKRKTGHTFTFARRG